MNLTLILINTILIFLEIEYPSKNLNYIQHYLNTSYKDIMVRPHLMWNLSLVDKKNSKEAPHAIKNEGVSYSKFRTGALKEVKLKVLAKSKTG